MFTTLRTFLAFTITYAAIGREGVRKPGHAWMNRTTISGSHSRLEELAVAMRRAAPFYNQVMPWQLWVRTPNER